MPPQAERTSPIVPCPAPKRARPIADPLHLRWLGFRRAHPPIAQPARIAKSPALPACLAASPQTRRFASAIQPEVVAWPVVVELKWKLFRHPPASPQRTARRIPPVPLLPPVATGRESQ